MSHDRVLNFLVRESYVPFDLFERVKTMLNLAGGTLSVDDSVLDKPYSNPAVQELIGRHYSGKHHKTVQGICLVTLFYTDVSGGRVPVNYRIYQQGGNRTKNDLFGQMLAEVLDWGVSPALVTGDSWYASKQNLSQIRRYGLDAFFAIEKARLISTQKGGYQQVGQAEIDENGVETHLRGFDFVTVLRKEQTNKDRHYIYYHHVPKGEKSKKATPEEFEKAHQEHWNVEQFHRAIKQLCNAENFLVRRINAVKNHLFSVYWAFVSLEQKVQDKLIKNWYQLRENLQLQAIRFNLT